MSSYLRKAMRTRKKVIMPDRGGGAFQTASCAGKLKFISFREAEQNVPTDVRSTTAGKGRLAPYKCTFCNHYHIGRSSFDSSTRHDVPRNKLVELED